MFRYDVVWSGMEWYGVVWRGVCGRILAEFQLSIGKKVFVYFLVTALNGLFSVGVRGVPQSAQEVVRTGNGDGWKHGVRLIHGCDSNASRIKAVSLESLRCFAGLKKCKSLALGPKKGRRSLLEFSRVE